MRRAPRAYHAWEAEQGFGVPARVFNAISLDDPREILSIGFVDVDASALGAQMAGVAEQEAVRHARIDEVIEATLWRAFLDLQTEHDLTGAPRQVELASADSLLASLRGSAGAQ